VELGEGVERGLRVGGCWGILARDDVAEELDSF
jgi:hypothetical protein